MLLMLLLYYQYFFKNKNKKSVKRTKIITQQPKPLGNPNITDIKWVTIEHSKTSYILSQTIRQSKKVSQVSRSSKDFTSPLYTETTKNEKFFDKKDYKKCKNSEPISCL